MTDCTTTPIAPGHGSNPVARFFERLGITLVAMSMDKGRLRQVERSYVVPEPLSAIGFNRRQYRVASALQSGATNKQIALQLGASEATVKYHLTSIYRLTGKRRRSELIDFISEHVEMEKI